MPEPVAPNQRTLDLPRARRIIALVRMVLFGVLTLAALFGSAVLFHRVFGTLGAIALGTVTGGALLGGVALSYSALADWLNLRLLKHQRSDPGARIRDGQAIAFECTPQVQEEPLRAPISGLPCAAYSYKVIYAGQGSKQRRLTVAEGFHLLPTSLRGGSRTLRLLSFPGLEPGLHNVYGGPEHYARLQALVAAVYKRSKRAGDPELALRRWELQSGEVASVSEDYLMYLDGRHAKDYHIEEEAMPVNRPVCVVGTYDQRQEAIRAGRFRPGGRLLVYDGDVLSVLRRVGAELRKNLRLALLLLGMVVALHATVHVYPAPPADWILGPPLAAVDSQAPDRVSTRTAVTLWLLSFAVVGLSLKAIGAIFGGGHRPSVHKQESGSGKSREEQVAALLERVDRDAALDDVPPLRDSIPTQRDGG